MTLQGNGDTSHQLTALDDDEKLAWLQLIRSENVGPVSFAALLDHCGDARTAMERLPDLSRQGGKREVRICSRDAAAREIDEADRLGARFVALCEPDYPPALAAADAPPPLIAVRGSSAIFTRDAVAIVGARNASLAGLKIASMIASGIGAAGYAVVSGLARGIDAAAHEASLETGTIAVLAGGLDRPYPPENLDLMQTIIDHDGAIISEMPFGWTPRARDFPRRNRLIAGIGLGLVVAEAAHRSGSLISARLAGELGRLVFAVPGSPLDPRARGSNWLLKEGAQIATSAEDVLEALAPLVDSPIPRYQRETPSSDSDMKPMPTAGDDDRERLISALGPVPMDVDEIIRHSGLAPASAQMVLLELDLAGRLERHPGSMVSLV